MALALRPSGGCQLISTLLISCLSSTRCTGCGGSEGSKIYHGAIKIPRTHNAKLQYTDFYQHYASFKARLLLVHMVKAGREYYLKGKQHKIHVYYIYTIKYNHFALKKGKWSGGKEITRLFHSFK